MTTELEKIAHDLNEQIVTVGNISLNELHRLYKITGNLGLVTLANQLEDHLNATAVTMGELHRALQGLKAAGPEADLAAALADLRSAE